MSLKFLSYYSVYIVNSTRLECTNGDVRLAGGEVEYEGNLNVCHSEEWGSVCSEAWSRANSVVVCRQLGFTPGN